MNIDLTADPAEIVQAQEPYDPAHPIQVSVCGTVETRDLPANAFPGMGTAPAVTATVGTRIFSMEPRRQCGTLIATDQDIYIATSQAGAQSGAAGAMRWPALVPYVVRHVHEVWVCAVTGTTDVGFETVNWSE